MAWDGTSRRPPNKQTTKQTNKLPPPPHTPQIKTKQAPQAGVRRGRPPRHLGPARAPPPPPPQGPAGLQKLPRAGKQQEAQVVELAGWLVGWLVGWLRAQEAQERRKGAGRGVVWFGGNPLRPSQCHHHTITPQHPSQQLHQHHHTIPSHHWQQAATPPHQTPRPSFPPPSHHPITPSHHNTNTGNNRPAKSPRGTASGPRSSMPSSPRPGATPSFAGR